MPELPEVETVRRGLEASVSGAKVTRVRVSGARTVRRQRRADFERFVKGRRLDGFARRGKFLLIATDGGILVCHLRMSGQLVLAIGPEVPLVAHTHAVFSLGDGRELRFVDPRTFGELFFCAPGGIDLDGVLAGLGRDPLVDGVDASYLAERSRGRRTAVKSFLVDQRQVCGIGNIYADEICFRARIRPDRAAGTIPGRRAVRLAEAIGEVLREAIELRGSSLADARYRDLFGDLGDYQDRHCVYGREGEPCVRCRTPIRRLVVAGRSTHYCPRCQR